MKLNLGCGDHPLEGWLNVDRFPGNGVDVVEDLTHVPWNWIGTSTADKVRASFLFEHLHNWEDVLMEVARVLRPAGILDVSVPAGLRAMGVPYEVRMFTERSFDLFCTNVRRPTCVPFIYRQPTGIHTLERRPPYFIFLRLRKMYWRYPFAWHLQQRFGDRTLYWPLGRVCGLEFLIGRNGRPWKP